MRTGFASLAIVGVAACVAVYALTQQPKSNSLYSNIITADDMAFLKFVSKFGKSFGTKEEFEFRANLFKSTLEQISLENSKNDNTFTLGINKFADWTPAEYKRILSYKPTRASRNVSESIPENVRGIPDNIDWRELKAVNPVKDQGQCGSCWAFSAVGAMEGRYAIESGNLLSLSEQQLVDCATGGVYQSQGCDGGEMFEGIDYAAANGMELEATYPYKAVDQKCAYNKDQVTLVKPERHDGVKQNSADALTKAVADGPVSVAIEADTLVFQFYQSGILNSKACGVNLDHGVVVVGYGTSTSKPYYIVRNSWGPSWGLNGYINIAIVDGAGICGIQMDAVVPVFKKK